MERKLLAIALSIILAGSCLPSYVYATEEYGVFVEGASDQGGGVTVVYADANGNVQETLDDGGSAAVTGASDQSGTSAESGASAETIMSETDGSQSSGTTSGGEAASASVSDGGSSAASTEEVIYGSGDGTTLSGTEAGSGLDAGTLSGSGTEADPYTYTTNTYVEDSGLLPETTDQTQTVTNYGSVTDGTYVNDGTEPYSNGYSVYAGEYMDSDTLDSLGLTIADDGTYEMTDEKGKAWSYDPDDPQLVRFMSGSDMEEIKYGYDPDRLFASGNTDPYVNRLAPDKSYRYPAYYKTVRNDELVDVHYGMDISYYQKDISLSKWKELKERGLDFVILRAGYRGYGEAGSLNVDKCFAYNVQMAHKAGIVIGAYFYSQAISVREAQEEAIYCMQIIEPYRDLITLPVITDYEYADTANGVGGRMKNARLSAAEHTAIVNAFCETVRLGGYHGGIYANKSMLTSDMILSRIPAENYIWMANFVSSGKDNVCSTTYSGRLNAWQYTSNFTGWGPSGLGLVGTNQLDMDFWYGDYPDAVKDQEDDAAETVEDVTVVEEPSWGDLERDENVEILSQFISSGKTPGDLPDKMWVYGLEKEMEYTGTAIRQPWLKVFYKNRQLVEGSDYKISYSSNTNVGEARAVVVGKGKYAGKKATGRFEIKGHDIGEGVYVSDVSYNYVGRVRKGKTIVLYPLGGRYVTLKEGKDFSYVYPGTDKKSANYDRTAFVGDKDSDVTYEVTIRGKGNFTGETTFAETILARNTEMIPVSKLKVESVPTQTLRHDEDGVIVPACPVPVVTYGGVPLTETEDGSMEDGYLVSYVNNDTLGTGTALITGTGRFSGTRRIDYKIAKQSIARAAVTNFQEVMEYTGEAVEQDGCGLFLDEEHELVEGRDYVISYVNNVKAGKNKASAVFRGLGIYSGTIRMKFSIR